MRALGKNTTGNGFTLLELLIAVAILGLITAMALPSYREYVDRTNNGLAIADIGRIEQAFELYLVDTNSLPPNLVAVGLGGLLDPWGNPYFYLRFDADTKKADKRKDKNLNPVNSDYDLYSMGADGETTRNFGAQKALDDIVRANDGRFVGLADDY